jgi:hypothetical protein
MQNRKAAEKDRKYKQGLIDQAKQRVGQYEADVGAWQGGIDTAGLMQAAQGPETSEFNRQGVQDVNQLVSPEAQAADRPLTQMLRGRFEEQLGRPELPPGYMESIARNAALQRGQLQQALGNRAAMTGAGPQQANLDAILAGRDITAGALQQQTQAPMLAEQIGSQRMARAQGFLDPRMARRTKGRTKTRESGTTTTRSPSAQIGNILAIHGTQKPVDPTLFLG